MEPERRNRLTLAVLIVGMALRVGLAVVTPATVAYDDHFTPIRLLLQEGRLPRPDQCWECYQPPLYYAVSAGVFRATAGAVSVSAAMKAVQLESALFGCLTLLVCRSVLRRVLATPDVEAAPHAAGTAPARSRLRRLLDAAGDPEALGLAVVAFLPQHVVMSAMATNDALTYLVASLAVWAALRAHAAGWPDGATLFAGALCGLAVLGKAYGMATAAAVAGAVALAALTQRERAPAAGKGAGKRRREARRRGSVRWGRAVLLVVAGAAAVGVWPAARNLRLYGRPQVDNFDFFKTRMFTQPPGSVSAVEWLTFRPVALLRHPWVHPSSVASFWTEMYAGLWFDYGGAISLNTFPPWTAFMNRVIARYAGRTPPGEAMIDYGPGDVPAGLARWARVSYVAGAPLAALVLAGLGAALLGWRRFPTALVALHACACLAVPVVQTIRLPFFAAMKPAFMLGAISSVPVFVALLLAALPARGRTAALIAGWAASATIALADVGYIVGQIRP